MTFKNKIIPIILCLTMIACLIFNVGCTKCEHQWGKLKLVTEATCTEEGVKERKCELCGEIKTVKTSMSAHKWKTANCTTPKTCKVCLVTEGEPRGHSFVNKVQKNSALKTQATVENPVEVYYKSCICGKVSDTETFEIKTMMGKNILIFGDSYSSYVGTIPNGYREYYTGSNILNSPDQMWWSLLTQERGGTIVRNDSSSGSTINTAGYHSFIDRLNKLYNEGFFTQNQIDYVYVLGGTNDNSSKYEVGEEMYSGWTGDDLQKIRPAITYFFTRLREILPNAEIFGLVNRDKITNEIEMAIRNSCTHINGKSVILAGISLDSGHPTDIGMMQIKDKVLQVFDK